MLIQKVCTPYQWLLIEKIHASQAESGQPIALGGSDLLQACPAVAAGDGSSTAADLDHRDAVRQMLVSCCALCQHIARHTESRLLNMQLTRQASQLHSCLLVVVSCSCVVPSMLKLCACCL